MGQELSFAQEAKVLASLVAAFVTYTWLGQRFMARPVPRGPEGQLRPVTLTARPGIDERVAGRNIKAA